MAAPAGSVARQPSHQICVAATVINLFVTIRLHLVMVERTPQFVDYGFASLPASFEENVPEYMDGQSFSAKAVPTCLPIQAHLGAAAGRAAHPAAQAARDELCCDIVAKCSGEA